ncbi:MAG: PSD1 and planctomycete cytochrome C domain-containing protein [Verrucomicrobiales bacterium]|nr:PSD1 and planctomycete cytochrome C domain-containing protein [Verrucomicrobiales bacterium]
MKRFFINALCLAVLASTPAVAAEPIDFVKDVRPIFEAHCYDCHGGGKQKSGLRLDVKSAALTGGDNHGPDIVPGKPEESPLIQFLLTENEDEMMPPKGARLSAKEIGILTEWVSEGAIWPDGVDLVELEDTSDHWSFKPIRVEEGEHTIDAFIDRALQEKGLKRSPRADKATLLRRLSFDLIGLPPTTGEMDAFLADDSTDAYSAAVERLLASPRYGERWAQHWLDVVRYADTHGFEVNTERKNAWPYRDYVIKAFNANTPWDQFIREQIAGDALGKAEATGFLVTAAALLPGQIGKDEESKRLARQDELGEIVINTGEAFLGLSIGCARCHDHKFDPISARDYYTMQAFFAGVHYGDRPVINPELDTIVDGLRERLRPLERELERYLLRAGEGGKRASLSAKGNIEYFAPVKAAGLRFTVHSTISGNRHQPYIDELEVFNTEGENIALNSKVTSKTGKPEGAIDGVYGNESAWKSSVKGGGSLEMAFENPETINRIFWGRDRTGKYPDRLAETYTFEIKTEGGDWRKIADASDRASFDPKKAKEDLFQLADFAKEDQARARVIIEDRKPLVEELKQYHGGKQLVFAAQSSSPETMHLLNRGDPEQPTDVVAPATLSFLNPVELSLESKDAERREALADWITDPDNPLTARVIVNRIWQWHFGIGLVSTANDFGNLGALPSHPKLLDWLAAEFIESGWSVKDLHRLIVSSEAYQQRHELHAVGLAKDSENRLLWGFPSRRIEAEVIRDSILAVSGTLESKMFGRGYDLFHARGGTGGFKPIESHLKEEGRRRMIYAYKVRMEREAVFGAFDCPDGGQSAPRRSQSTTPIQALNLFNSQFTIDLAAEFSERVRKEVGDDPDEQIQRVWKICYGRSPANEELLDAGYVVREHGLETLSRVIFNSNEFLFLP